MDKKITITTRQDFETAYEKYIDRIFRFLTLRINDRERAKEMAQETFMRAWKYLVDGHMIEHPQAFFYTTAHNLLKNEYRSRRNVISLETAMDEELGFERLIAEDPVAEDMAEAHDLVRKIEFLPPLYQEIVRSRYIDGLSVQEIARKLRMSAVTVSVRLHRGIKKLRSVYEKEAFSARSG